ncbi:hypothetical protein [Pedobacter frigiditerrae]|uniref:hypothetical protein n=1 Tax=Pedobacter frigiditerrae TaxID=2530452 RepID=UPI002930014E|nr:hypothetical protein [Pedobacter frigiditerrae]
MKGISPWSLAAKAALTNQKLSSLYENKLGNYHLSAAALTLQTKISPSGSYPLHVS